MARKWWTLLAVSAGIFMLLLDVTIVVVALPEIQASLHARFSEVQWVVDAYALTLASLLLTSGVFADRYGRRRLFASGIAVFTLGSLLCGLAQSPLMLILARSGQGVGGAIVFATSLALLGESFRGKDRAVAFAVWGAIAGVAVALGPVLGGLITSGVGWRGIFLVNVPVGIAAVWVTLRHLEESRAAEPGRPDWAGFALLTAGLVSLIYGLIRASETRWLDIGVLACLAAAAALLASFVLVEWRAADPMLDLSLFRIPTFVGGSIAALAMNGSLFAMFLFLVLYLQDVLGYSALGAGLRLLVVSGGMLLAAALAGRLSEHLPMRWLIGPGLALVGAGLLLMRGITATSSWHHLIAGFIVSGLGAGLVNPPLGATAIGVVAPERAGMANGVNTTFRQIGIASGIAALGSIFATALQHHLKTALAGDRALANHASQIIDRIHQGNIAAAINLATPASRPQLQMAIQTGFATGLNTLLLVTGVIALVGAAAALILIRDRDMVAIDPASNAMNATRPDSVRHPSARSATQEDVAT